MNKIHKSQQPDGLLEKLINVAENHQTEDKSKPTERQTHRKSSREEYNRVGKFGRPFPKRNFGTLDNQKLEKELANFNVNMNEERKKKKRKFDKTINVKEYEPFAVETSEREEDNNKNLLENFESFSQQKDTSNVSFNSKNIYNKNYVKKKTNTSRLGLGSDIGDDKMSLKSEKVIIKGLSKKLNDNIQKTVSKSSPKKDPGMRFSVKNSKFFAGKLNVVQRESHFKGKASLLSSNVDDNERKQKDFKISEIGLDYNVGNIMGERANPRNNELDISNADSVTFPDEPKNFKGSKFSSASERQSNYKSEKISFNPLASFGNRPNEIVIEFLNNWGSPFQIGLTETKFFDMNNVEIKLKKNNVKFLNRNKEVDTESDLMNLFNDRIVSMNRNDMFVVDYNKRKNKYSINFKLPLTADIGSLVLWNFNEDPDKGVEKFKVLFGSIEVFKGELPKANGKVSNCMNYKIIRLNPKFDKSSLIEHLSQEYGLVRKKPKIQEIHSDISPQEQGEPQSLTPKNKLRGRSNIYDKARTPNPSKKSLYPIGGANNIKIPSDNSILTRKRINNKMSIEGRFGKKEIISKRKSGLEKSEAVFRSKSKNLLNPGFSLHGLVETYKEEEIPFKPLLDGLTCKLLSNWDDKTAIGLNGIEIFNTEGHRLQLKKKHIKVVTPNDKPPSNQADRENIVNEGLNTCDVNQHWSFALEGNLPLTLKIKFDKQERIAMIRIWNYNVSRTRASKGVRELVISDLKDRQLLFGGILKKASGMLIKPSKNYESVLFVKEKKDLVKIAANDWLYSKFCKKIRNEVQRKIKNHYNDFLNQRPTMTDPESMKGNNMKSGKFGVKDNLNFRRSENKSSKFIRAQNMKDNVSTVSFKKAKITVLENWGHTKEFGIMGIEFYNKQNKPISNSYFVVSSKNKLISDDPSNTDRNVKMKKSVLFRLRNNDENSIEISFKKKVQVAFICVYNVDGSSVETKKGIKKLALYLDGNLMTGEKGLYIKKGSKHKFMRKQPQRISFPLSQLVHNVKPKPSYITPISSPTGFTIEFRLKSTFGDPYYIGLNAIEIFDLMGNNLLVKENEGNFKLTAEPAGVHVLPEMSRDLRVAKNLYNGNNLSEDNRDTWLTTFVKFDKSLQTNIIIVEFKDPVILGVVNIWNYTKTHHRAVKEMEIYLDDNIIFCGPLNNIKERLLSSIFFNEVFKKKRVDHIKIEPIIHFKNERSALDNEGRVLNKISSDKFLGIERPTTGFIN